MHPPLTSRVLFPIPAFCSAFLIFIVQPADWLVFVLAAFAALFAGYLCRVLNRCRCRIEMEASSLRE